MDQARFPPEQDGTNTGVPTIMINFSKLSTLG
jgi:hypothetical protein